MHDYLLSFLLGIIEGLTEFLPVSSTAHLRISEALLGIDLSNGFWKMYSIVIQLGAILCLPVYFRQRIGNFLSTFPQGERGDRSILTHPLSLTLVAFVITAIPAFLLTKIIGKHLESIHLMAWALQVGVIATLGAVLPLLFRIRHPRSHLIYCHLILILALVFLSLFGLFTGLVLVFAQTGFKTTSVVKTRSRVLYGTDGGIDYGIQTLRADATNQYCANVSQTTTALPDVVI